MIMLSLGIIDAKVRKSRHRYRCLNRGLYVEIIRFKMEKERFVLKFRFMLSSVTNRGYGRSIFFLILVQLPSFETVIYDLS